MKRQFAAVWCGAVLGFGAGCGDDEPKKVNDTAGLPDSGGLDVSEPDGEVEPITGAVEGTWAMLEVQTALATTDLLGTQVQTSTNLYLAKLDDGAMTAELCDWETKDEAGQATTRMGAQVLAHLTPLVRTYTVSQDGDVWNFATDRGVQLRGVALTEPFTDAVPTDATDARVVDQDEDGHPGITLIVSGLITGEFYSVHRHIAKLSGSLASDTRISGRTEWTTDQVVFASEPPIIAQQNPKAVTHPDAALSHFTMVKIDAADTCATLAAKRSVLFPK